MGLLEKLKSAIGLGGSGSDRGAGPHETASKDVDVTVEHRPEPDAESEAAVKGTAVVDPDDSGETPGAEATGDAATSREDGAAVTGETETAPTAGTEPSTSASESDSRDASSVEAREPGETATAPTAESATAPDEESSTADVPNADEPVDTITGIGPSYASTLGEIGIETVGDLAAADAESIEERTDLSAKRVGRWIDSARGEDE